MVERFKNERGEAMGATIITITAIVLVALLLFLYPLLNVAESDENIIGLDVQTLVDEFTTIIAERGEINQRDLDMFVEQLLALNFHWNIELEVIALDDNPGKKVVVTTSDAIGENLTITQFTEQIMNGLDAYGVYSLEVGDIVSVTVNNTNRTMGEILRGFFTPGTGGTSRIRASATRMVT